MSLFMRTNKELEDGRVLCTTYERDGSVTLAITFADRLLGWMGVSPEALAKDPKCLDYYRERLAVRYPRGSTGTKRMRSL